MESESELRSELDNPRRILSAGDNAEVRFADVSLRLV
jgi:hypothetical protein